MRYYDRLNIKAFAGLVIWLGLFAVEIILIAHWLS
jgi:hypothetical protein